MSEAEPLPDVTVGMPPPDWFRNAMANAPRRSRVAVEGAAIEVLEWGTRGAPGLLLMHGFRAHAAWWSHIAPLLSDVRHVVAMSWSGMGGSEHRPSYSLAQYAREAVAVAEATGLFDDGARPMMVAHSLGGHVGALLAATVGDRLAGMVLVDTGLGPDAKKPPRDPQRRVFSSVEEMTQRFRLTPSQPVEPYIMRHIAESSVTPVPGEGWEWCFDPDISAKLERPHYWEQLAQATCPLAFVRGEHSRVVSAELQDVQHGFSPPGTPFIVVPAAGHHLMVDHPIALAAVLRTLCAAWPHGGAPRKPITATGEDRKRT